MKIGVIIHEAEEGGFWAEVPALPGCVTQGETKKEIRKNVNDAIEGWMKVNEAMQIKKARKSGKVKIVSVAV
jgi:predicted RNase H-like HicB family nuclease